MIKIADLLKEEECNECGRDWNHGHDHEAGMAKNELRDMISNASKIDTMVGESDNLPGWVSAYISLAADYMHSVAEYLTGESSKMDMPGPGYGLDEGHDEELEHYVSKYIKDPDHIDAEMNAYAEKGYQGFSDMLRANLSRDMDFQTWVQMSHDDEQFRKERGLEEKKKPSAGLTKKEKSAVVKKAKAGKDIGKKGKGFEKLAKAAGGGEKGEKIAAAAMWKNIKR